MSFIEAEVKTDLDDLEQQIENIVDDNMMFEINMLFSKMCDPYVPYNTGKLARSKQVSPDGVKYLVPYADRVYNGIDMNFRQDKHPFATARWDEAMMTIEGDLFMQKVEEMIQAKIKRLYG